jgi:hypothetical protein
VLHTFFLPLLDGFGVIKQLVILDRCGKREEIGLVLRNEG